MARPPRSRRPAFKRGVAGVRGVPQQPGLVPILHLEGADATWSTNDLATWPARVGPTPTVATGRGTPQKGATANSLQGVQFRRASSDQLNVGSVQGTPSDYTVQVVYSAVNKSQVGDREYMLRSYAAIDTDDIICAHISNLSGGYLSGYFDGSAGSDADPGGGWHQFKLANWRGTNVKALPTTRLHVDTFVLSTGGCALYRDGVLQGSNAQYTRRAMTALHISGTEGTATSASYFEGTIYQIKIWNRALPVGTVTLEQSQAMVRFGIAAWPSTAVDDPSTIFGANLIAWYDASNPYYTEYSDALSLAALANRADSSLYVASGSGSNPSYDQEGIGSRPTASITAGQGLLANALAAAIFDGSPPTGLTIFAVAKNKAGGGQDSTDGKIASFGDTTANPRHELLMRAGPTVASPAARSLRLSDAGTSRSIMSVANPGTTLHLLIGTQDETGDTGTIEMDAVIATSGTTNLLTTTLTTFAIGHRRTTVNTDTTAYLDIACVGVVDRVLTTPERESLRAWATALWGTP